MEDFLGGSSIPAHNMLRPYEIGGPTPTLPSPRKGGRDWTERAGTGPRPYVSMRGW